MRNGLLALFVCLLVLPASAHASSLRVTVVIHGPGKVTGTGNFACDSTVGNTDSKICGTISVGTTDEVSSTYAAFASAANAAQPNKSAFVKWTCTTSTASCGGCDTGAGCQMTSTLAKGINDVLLVAEFSDTTAPAAPVVSRSYSDTVDRQVSFGLTSNDTIDKALCSLDGAAFTTCAVGSAYTLAPGTHTFRAKTVDPSDLSSPTSATTSVHVIDTTLTDGPADASSDATPTLRFTGLSGVAFECELDGGGFSACGTGNAGSQLLGPLADGQHTFKVRARDGADYDHVPAARTWTVDRTPPTATLDPFTGPGQGALQAFDHETFAFSLSEPGSTECSLDAAPFALCTSPAQLTGLAPGTHSFSVRGTDTAGNLGAPATRTWAIARETTGNTVVIVQAPRPAPKPAFKLAATGKGTKLKTLRATGVPKGATITVTCTGKGCPKKRYVKANAPATVDLSAFRKLPGTATLKVTATLDGGTATHTLKTRRGKAPRIT